MMNKKHLSFRFQRRILQDVKQTSSVDKIFNRRLGNLRVDEVTISLTSALVLTFFNSRRICAYYRRVI